VTILIGDAAANDTNVYRIHLCCFLDSRIVAGQLMQSHPQCGLGSLGRNGCEERAFNHNLSGLTHF
jgi:hypothetical protein